MRRGSTVCGAMESSEFAAMSMERVETCLTTLNAKGEEYSRYGDRLHNFKTAGRIMNVTPSEALWGMYIKHLVSVQNMVQDIAAGKTIPHSAIQEKIGDSINYHLLLEGLIYEHNLSALCGQNEP